MVTYEKDKITIHLEGEDVTDFWDIIMYALDYNNIAKGSKSKKYTQMTENQLKLAEKLEELSRPHYG